MSTEVFGSRLKTTEDRIRNQKLDQKKSRIQHRKAKIWRTQKSRFTTGEYRKKVQHTCHWSPRSGGRLRVELR